MPSSIGELDWDPLLASWILEEHRNRPLDDPAIGTSGAAGLCTITRGDTAVSICTITGRVSSIRVTPNQDESAVALLRAFMTPDSIPEPTNLLAPDPPAARRPVHVKITSAADRPEITRLTVLEHLLESVHLEISSIPRKLLAVERSSILIGLRDVMPGLSSDEVLRNSLDEAAGLVELTDPPALAKILVSRVPSRPGHVLNSLIEISKVLHLYDTVDPALPALLERTARLIDTRSVDLHSSEDTAETDGSHDPDRAYRHHPGTPHFDMIDSAGEALRLLHDLQEADRLHRSKWWNHLLEMIETGRPTVGGSIWSSSSQASVPVPLSVFASVDLVRQSRGETP